MLKRALLLLCAGGSALLLFACASLEGAGKYPSSHPKDTLGAGNPMCTECHDGAKGTIPYQRFDHTGAFVRGHRMAASQNEQACAMCHAPSFCNECHAVRTELKPSSKDPTATYRSMPHRGDYLTRHRIDGRIEPTSCFRCHGSPKSSKTCARCHG